LGLNNSELTLVVTNLEFEESDIFESLLILNFTSSKSTLKNLNLLIKKSKLVISSDELSSKNISLVDNTLIVFLELLNFIIGFLDDI
jgi:hypothetical protein